MAIQKTLTWNGITVPNAYISVDNQHGKEIISLDVGFYTVDSAGKKTRFFLDKGKYRFLYSFTSTLNVIKQAYVYLLSLPEFEGAITILEPGDPDYVVPINT